MSRRILVLCALLPLMASAVLLPSNARADQKNNKNSAQEKKDDARVKQQAEDVQRVQKELQGEERELADAEKDLTQAQAALKNAGREEDATRDRVEATQGRTIGIDRAIQAQTEAKKSFDTAAAPVLAALKESAAYKAAKARADKGHQELKQVAAQTDLTADERRRREAAANVDALAVANLEKETLEGHADVKALKGSADEAAQRVQELRARIKSAVDKDSTVRSAHDATSKARDAVETAQRRVAQQRNKVASARAKLAKESADVAQAKAADKANDNKKPNNKNKK